MARTANRSDFIDDIKTELGIEFLPIEISEKQYNNLLDDTIEYFQEFVIGFTNTQAIKLDTIDGTHEYNLNSNILGVEGILERGFYNDIYFKFPTEDRSPEFTQWTGTLNNYFENNISSFEIAAQNVRMIKSIMSTRVEYEFRPNGPTIYFPKNPQGCTLYLICNIALDYDETGSNYIWSNQTFKNYYLAKCYEQVYRNVAKFNGFQLPGGGEINIDFLREQGPETLEKLEEWIKENYFDIEMFSIHMA